MSSEDENLENRIVAQGEILSTNLVQLFLEESNISSSLISALDFMVVDEEGEPVVSKIKEKLCPIINKKPSE